MLTYCEIGWGTEQYEQEIELRDRLLRIPLGLLHSESEIQTEHDQLHFGAFVEMKLVGCVVGVPLSERLVKLRQMAIDSAHQRGGIGTGLLKFCESALASRGFQTVELNARETAIEFYVKSGYRHDGPQFTEVGLPHQKMVKDLATAGD